MGCVEETWCHGVCGGDLVPWGVWRRPGAMGSVEETWCHGIWEIRGTDYVGDIRGTDYVGDIRATDYVGDIRGTDYVSNIHFHLSVYVKV